MSVNSRYTRKPQDLPIQGRRVRLHLSARRWLCKNPACSRTTFCETFPDLAVKYGQRTKRTTEILRKFILAVSSTTSKAFAKQAGIEVSLSTLLRLVGTSDGRAPTPRILGVDDFAVAKGHKYNTLLVDLESGRPIDVLAGRSKEVLLGWLQGRSGIEVVARDRSSAYADAIREGAPSAVQVADRFHLVKNLVDALKELVDRQRWTLPEPPCPPEATPAPAEPVPKSEAAPTRQMTRDEQRKAAAAARLQHRYHEVHRLHNTGLTSRQIQAETGLSSKTIRKYLNSDAVPRRAESTRRRSRLLDPYIAYLDRQWHDGHRNTYALYNEIQQQGYTGSLATLRELLQPWRAAARAAKIAPTPRRPKSVPKHRVSWKEVRSAVLCLPEQLTDSQQQILPDFLALHPELKLGRDLIAEFRQLLVQHTVSGFEGWLERAAQSGLAPFERLARTLKADGDAVRAAITMPWSSGPVEGHVNRIKLIKRIGYGRAGLNLLRARILATVS